VDRIEKEYPNEKIHIRGFWYSTDALADTGADYSLLPLRYGRLLVKDIKSGKYDTLKGRVPDCSLPVYYHSLKCRINKQEFMIRVGISEGDDIWPIFGRTLGLDLFDINFLKGTKCVFKE